MEIEQYKVDILHLINPHLIWALVQKEGEENAFYFEQIGIYGIMPQNYTFKFDCVVKPERCEQWMPAASAVMLNCLKDADYVYFSPTYIDKKSSIFDDNTHKYGELTVVKKNGEQVDVGKEIITSHFACEDECLFHQELMGNNIKTHLSDFTLYEVVTKIENAHKTRNIPKTVWMETLKKQMSVYQDSKHLESLITSRKLNSSEWDVDTLLKNKQNVFKLCKDIDDVSVGRACSLRKTPTSSAVSVALRKKLEWLEAQSIYNQPKEHEPTANDNIKAVYPESQSKQQTDKVYAVPSDKKTNGNTSEENNNSDATKAKNHSSGDILNAIRKGKKPWKIIEPEALVAYGPAGLQTCKFNIKQQPAEVKKDPVKEEDRKPERPEEPEEVHEVTKEQDVYANIDSEVNLKITNLEILKKIKSKNSVQNDTISKKPKSKPMTPGFLKRKIRYLEKKHNSLVGSKKDSSQADDSDNESITVLEEELGLRNKKIDKEVTSEPQPENTIERSNVNPFKNVDGTISIFVDKLVTPVLMVHTKKNNRIEPVSNMRDIPFGTDIHMVLRNMTIQNPMRPQTVSWPTILRGHSVFLIGPYNSGNTMGYLPAVCRLVYDFKNTADRFGLSCIIVCATSNSVASVEYHSKMFLHRAKIFACHVGMSDIHISTSLLNGCDLLICTPSMLVRLIQEDFSLDFRNLSTIVVDDCEHISSVYPKELKFILLKIRDIVKNRVHKEWKVQYIMVSRIWCDFMTSLARKAPDSVVCISAFEECVPYSKTATSVEFVVDEKITAVVNFMNDIDKSKKTVIVCRTNDEVKLLENTLTQLKYVVFSCDNTMTVQDLYNLDKTLKDYEEPVSGPVLICCDGNLTHLNVTDAHYLIHYSLPDLFSMFCKRFAVLIDNYPSIFKGEESNIKIKILIDDNNIEQLPKILQFIKRCTDNIPPGLDEVSSRVLTQKYYKKAQNFVPVCRNLLTLGKCPDYSNCIERHAIFKEFDSPKSWLPTEGLITFKILHYHSAVHYSARITSCAIKSNITNYTQTYSLLSIKMGMYFSKMENRKLHSMPKVGDVCAVTLNQNLFVRCQISKVLKSERNQPTCLLIKLLDEERYEMARDINLYYLPDDLKNIETHVVTVILANLVPQDKDVTFSKLAENHLKRITDNNDELFMRGQIALVVGNTILVDTLEACQDLSSLAEVVVKSDFRKELLDGHALPNPDHIDNLREVSDFNNVVQKEEQPIEIPISNPIKVLPKGRWAHLESDEFSTVFLMYAENPSQFFVRLIQFDECLTTLIDDIYDHVTENPEPVESINVGDIVLAEFPDDSEYERARIDSNITYNKVKCFFVDQGKWRDVSIKKIYPITEQFITQLPFQAIECRLIGIRPPGNNWTDFSTNFFVGSSFDSNNKRKHLFAKYFTKEKAEFSEGHKYGVVLIDTYSAEDVIMNLMMIDKNLAEENDEIEFINNLQFKRESEQPSDSAIEDETKQMQCIPISESNLNDLKSEQSSDSAIEDETKHMQCVPVSKSNKLIRSVPLVDPNINFDDFELVPDESGKNVCSIPISELLNIWKQNNMGPSKDSRFKKESKKNSDDKFEPYPKVSKTDKPLHVNNNRTQNIPSSKSNMSDDSCNDFDDFDFVSHDSGKAGSAEPVSSIPISEVVSIEELPDTEWSEKDLALPIGKTTCPTNKSPKPNISTESSKQVHKPKIIWRQNKNIVTITIELITKAYDITIKERYMKFSADVSGTKYGFDFELYGVVNLEKSTHCNKGRYLLIKLCKVRATNWLTLTRDNEFKKWIVYDVDSLNISSDEESDILDQRERLVHLINDNVDTDSDDNLLDD